MGGICLGFWFLEGLYMCLSWEGSFPFALLSEAFSSRGSLGPHR